MEKENEEFIKIKFKRIETKKMEEYFQNAKFISIHLMEN